MTGDPGLVSGVADAEADAPIDSSCTDEQHAAMEAAALQQQQQDGGAGIRFIDN